MINKIAILLDFRAKKSVKNIEKKGQGIILPKSTMQVTILVYGLSALVLVNMNFARQENGMKTEENSTQNGKEQKIGQRRKMYGSNKVYTSDRRYWINSVELETTKWDSKLTNFAHKHRIVKRNSAPCYHRKTVTSARNYTRAVETTSWPANPCSFVARTPTIQPLVTRRTKSQQADLKCSHENTCEGRCMNTTDWRTENKFGCFCDSDCYEVFDDCCSDYVKFCGVQKPKNNLKKTLAWNCVQLGHIENDINVDIHNKMSDGVWMVTQCTPDWPHDYIRQYCEDPKITPASPDLNRVVPILNGKNVTFRNLYCAKCNRAADTYDPWMFEIATEVMPPAQFNLTEQICFYLSHKAKIRLYRPKDHQPRRYCAETVVETCPEKKKGKKIIKKEKSCRNGEVELVSVSPKKHYINKKCARCNNENSFSCFPEANLENTWKVIPFSLVLNFQHSKDVQPKLRKAICRAGLVFDEVLQVCTMNWLQPLPEAGPERYYVISWLQAIRQRKVSLSKTVVQQSFIDYFQCLPENFNVSDIEHIKDFFLVKSTITLTSKQSLQLRSKCDKHCFRTSKIMKFIYFKTSWSMKIQKRNFNVFKTTSRPLKCFGRKVYTSDEYSSLGNGKIFINHTNTTYEKTQYFTDITASGSNVLGNVSVCEKYVPTSCNSPWKVLSPGQFQILENLSVYGNNTSGIYHYGQYEVLENNSVRLCISRYVGHAGHSVTADYDEVLSWITSACFLLSILSLIVLLTTYIIFPELRTLPGKNLMNLATSLLMFAISWLILGFTSHPNYCQVLITIQHYFLVASFTSMSVISFHTYKTFARELPAQRPTGNHERKLFKTYLTFIWVLPAIFVAICFLLDLNNIMNLGYGDSTLCWFRQKDAFVYFIYIPAALSLLFNIVTFFITALYLRKHNQNMAARKCGSKQRSNLAIYIKLSSLMGFTWLFGFLDVVGSTKVFEYLFVILTCLQGVCVTVAFVFKKKTMRMYKEMLSSGLKSKTPAKKPVSNLTRNTSWETVL